MKWKVVAASEYAKHKDQWDALNTSSLNLPVLHSNFVEPLITSFFKGKEYLALGFEDNKLVASGFFEKVGQFQWSSVMPSQAPITLWLHQDHALASKDIAGLARSLPGIVLTIDFLQMDSRDLTLEPESAFQVMPYITTGNRPIPKDFDSYFASLGKNMRQNYNKVLNRAERAGDELAYEVISTPEGVKEAVKIYGDIESKGWKSEHGTAISPENDQGRFYSEMLSRLAEKNQACCWFYKINQQIVAVDLCVMQSNTLIILKTTYDEAFSKQSPALQLKVDMLRYYSNNDTSIENMEFYGRVMQWHTRLNSDTRALQHITWFASPLIRILITTLKSLRSKGSD